MRSPFWTKCSPLLMPSTHLGCTGEGNIPFRIAYTAPRTSAIVGFVATASWIAVDSTPMIASTTVKIVGSHLVIGLPFLAALTAACSFSQSRKARNIIAPLRLQKISIGLRLKCNRALMLDARIQIPLLLQRQR